MLQVWHGQVYRRHAADCGVVCCGVPVHDVLERGASERGVPYVKVHGEQVHAAPQRGLRKRWLACDARRRQDSIADRDG